MQNEALGIKLDAIEGKKEGRSKSAFCLRNKISETAGTKCQMTRNDCSARGQKRLLQPHKKMARQWHPCRFAAISQPHFTLWVKVKSAWNRDL
jgi:hypothetical protein